MTVTEMTAEIYRILGMGTTGTAEFDDTLVLLMLKQAHARLAQKSRCYKRRYVISPVIQKQAAGTITIDVANVSDGDYVTINGLKYTFKTALTTTFQVLIGSTNEDTAKNLEYAIGGSTQDGACLTDTYKSPFVTASAAAGVVTLTAILYGTEGNDLTLVKSGTALTVSGAKLTGGVDGRFYSLSSDLFDIDNIYYGSTILEAVPIARIDNLYGDYWRNNAVGTPYYWFKYGSLKFGVDTPPDGRYPFYIEGFVIPSATSGYAELSAGTDEPVNIPDEYCLILVYDVCVNALGGVIGDTVDGSQLRLTYCSTKLDVLYDSFMGSMISY